MQVQSPGRPDRRLVAAILVVATSALGAAACRAERDEPVTMAEAIDWSELEVSVRETTLTVPAGGDQTATIERHAPLVMLDVPDDVPTTERTIQVEVQAAADQKVTIQELRLAGDRLLVISKLEPAPNDLGTFEQQPVSDRVVLDGPDLAIDYYIIGPKPESIDATRFRFVPNLESVPPGRTIYAR